jgi:hypothetical protein
MFRQRAYFLKMRLCRVCHCLSQINMAWPDGICVANEIVFLENMRKKCKKIKLILFEFGCGSKK